MCRSADVDVNVVHERLSNDVMYNYYTVIVREKVDTFFFNSHTHSSIATFTKAGVCVCGGGGGYVYMHACGEQSGG